MQMETLTLRLPAPVVEKFRRRCRLTNIGVHDAVQIMLCNYLKSIGEEVERSRPAIGAVNTATLCEFLEKEFTVSELAARACVSNLTMRQRMTTLERLQLIQKTAMRDTGSRPAACFGLTPDGLKVALAAVSPREQAAYRLRQQGIAADLIEKTLDEVISMSEVEGLPSADYSDENVDHILKAVSGG